MKKLITSIALLTSIAFFGQTNKLDSTGNVGIGTTNPSSPLTINGLTSQGWNSGIELNREGSKGWILSDSQGIKFRNSVSGDGFWFRNSSNATSLVIQDGGNVGIGVYSPSAKLHVQSTADVALGSIPPLLVGVKSSHHIAIDGNEIGAFNNNQYSTLYINTSGSTSNTIMNSAGGYVGIGTENPDSKLTVNGKIHCREVQVDLAVAPDYVFQKYYTGSSELKEDYTMPTLEEVAAYTKENHHLPNIPSAKTIQEEGLHLKEMTNLLLQKIEELTLYTIEQEKRIKALEGKLATEK